MLYHYDEAVGLCHGRIRYYCGKVSISDGAVDSYDSE